MADLDEAKRQYEKGLDGYRIGEYDEALEALNRARDLFAEAGDRKAEADALNDIGVVCVQLEDWEQAKGALQEALTIRMAMQDRSGEGMTLGNLGMMHARQGENEEAAESYAKAIAIFQELGERGNEKAVARQLGKLKMKRGRFLDALGDYQAELAGEESPGGPQKVARNLFRMLGRLTGGGEPAEAEDEDTESVEGGEQEGEA
jgi:tetratricopeptide (TPR) repeat protein